MHYSIMRVSAQSIPRTTPLKLIAGARKIAITIRRAHTTGGKTITAITFAAILYTPVLVACRRGAEGRAHLQRHGRVVKCREGGECPGRGAFGLAA